MYAVLRKPGIQPSHDYHVMIAWQAWHKDRCLSEQLRSFLLSSQHCHFIELLIRVKSYALQEHAGVTYKPSMCAGTNAVGIGDMSSCVRIDQDNLVVYVMKKPAVMDSHSSHCIMSIGSLFTRSSCAVVLLSVHLYTDQHTPKLLCP